MKSKRQKGESEEDSDSQNSIVIDTDNSPKCIPVCKLPDKLKTKKIVINISDTQYPIVEEIAEQLGWTVQKNEGVGDWDVWWTDRQLPPDTLYKMNLYQKINHFPGIYNLARKNLLGMNLMLMRELFPKEYDFFPETWIIPLQFSQFRIYYESTLENKVQTYIVKPEAMSQGKGIFLTKNIQDIINGNKYVIQRYITNPLLIEELKFDLRIYVLIASVDPLRIYVYEEGLTRFATRKYQQPTQKNLNESYIHLTNYSLNKKNPQYVSNDRDEDEEIGHKRSLTSTYKYLEKLGHNVTKLKQQINDLLNKTIIAGYPPIFHQYQYCQPQQFENSMCFHILGFDILLDCFLKPYLIEVNHTPSFHASTPLDIEVKKNLIKDSLKLMRITSENKVKYFQKNKAILKRRIESGKRNILRGVQREKMISQTQTKRDEIDEKLKGNFKKIFPPTNEEMMEVYKNMIAESKEVHKQTDENRKKMFRDDQINKIRQKNQSKEVFIGGRSQNISADNESRKKYGDTNQNLKEKDSKEKGVLPIKEVKFRILPHQNRYLPQKNIGDLDNDSWFSMRKAVAGKKKIINASTMQKRRGSYVTPKTYEIVEKGFHQKMFDYEQSLLENQLVFRNINKSLAHYKIDFKSQTPEGRRDMKILQKNKSGIKKKKLSVPH